MVDVMDWQKFELEREFFFFAEEKNCEIGVVTVTVVDGIGFQHANNAPKTAVTRWIPYMYHASSMLLAQTVVVAQARFQIF
jgi:hypothetical protein